MKKQSWFDSNKSGPWSLWGKVQEATTIERGVRWVTTAGHGGFMISPVVAVKRLSIRALDKAQRYGDYYCFEEDCLCSIVFWEHPEWFKALTGRDADMDILRKSIERWNPGYFK